MAIAAAAAVLLAGCGGGSGAGTSTHAGTRSNASTSGPASASGAVGSIAPANGRQLVSAVDGDFQAVFPSGYRNNLAAAAEGAHGVEYAAVGPRIDGFATNLVIYRGAAGDSGIRAVAARALRHLAQRPAFLPKVRRRSSLHALKVDGEPALAVHYQLAAHTLTYHYLVFVAHGGWAYQISDTTVPAQCAASLGAIGELIRGWRWQ